MSSPYRVVRDKIGLTEDSGSSQDFHIFYLLLSALAEQDETLGPASVTYSNPFREVLHRLSIFEGHGLQALRQIIGARAE